LARGAGGENSHAPDHVRMCAHRSIRSHWNRDRPRYVYGATRSSGAEPVFGVWSKPLLDQKRDLDFRFSAQVSSGTSRGCYPPTRLICEACRSDSAGISDEMELDGSAPWGGNSDHMPSQLDQAQNYGRVSHRRQIKTGAGNHRGSFPPDCRNGADQQNFKLAFLQGVSVILPKRALGKGTGAWSA